MILNLPATCLCSLVYFQGMGHARGVTWAEAALTAPTCMLPAMSETNPVPAYESHYCLHAVLIIGVTCEAAYNPFLW